LLLLFFSKHKHFPHLSLRQPGARPKEVFNHLPSLFTGENNVIKASTCYSCPNTAHTTYQLTNYTYKVERNLLSSFFSSFPPFALPLSFQ